MNAIEFTQENFDENTASGRVMLSFWAKWCGPCMALYPLIEEIAAEADGRYKVGRVNVDMQGELVAKYKVMSVPTAVILENGEEINRFIGGHPKDTYVNALIN